MNSNVIIADNPARIVKRKEDHEREDYSGKAIDFVLTLQCKDMKTAADVEMIFVSDSVLEKQKRILTVQQTIRTLCIYTECSNNSYK